MKAKLYTVHCLTNLHVGSGDVNFNIIDNEVERDPVTGYPTIHSSGVKGALRSHFRGLGVDAAQIDKFFGKAIQADEGISAGQLKFFNADMLAIPMRASAGERPYALVTTDAALEHLQMLTEAILNRSITVQSYDQDVFVEGLHCTAGKRVLGWELTVMPESDFRQVKLPVLARNCLETGRENLWYEEIVPHQSLLTLFIACPDDTLDAFDAILKANPIVQFGGNASIGYGVCKVTEVSL